MVLLLDLPTEIIADIAGYLQPRSKRPLYRPWANVVDPRDVPVNLMRLCLTCSLLRDIVQPMIFRTILIHYRNTGADSTFADLARTFSRRPLLAEEVRSVLFVSEPSGQYDAEEEETWAVGLSRIALPMLALLFNVTSLHFQCNRFIPVQSPLHLGKQLLSNCSKNGEAFLLPRLRALYISPEDGTEQFVRVADFAPFFRHPGLKHISIYSGVLLDSLVFWKLGESYQFPAGSLHISELSLPGCLFDQRSAQMLIEACSGLKSLLYSQLNNDVHHLDEELGLEDVSTRDHFYQQPLLDPRSFSSILGTRKDTLEDLQVSFQRLNGALMKADLKFSGLRNFGRLAILKIEARHMTSFHDLPPTLKHLTLMFKATYSLPAKSLPSDLAEFFQSTEDPQKTPWLSLRSMQFKGVFDRDKIEKDALFRQAIANGTWICHSERQDPCCLVWRSGNVEFTLKDPVMHNLKLARWKLIRNEANM
ncbi:Nn.00g060940.m01.CDS01 [Neocucurbitaria sp. VM-36]